MRVIQLCWFAVVLGVRVETPNDPKLSDRRSWRDRCVAGGEGGGQEAAGVTAEPVRCSAWLDAVRTSLETLNREVFWFPMGLDIIVCKSERCFYGYCEATDELVRVSVDAQGYAWLDWMPFLAVCQENGITAEFREQKLQMVRQAMDAERDARAQRLVPSDSQTMPPQPEPETPRP